MQHDHIATLEFFTVAEMELLREWVQNTRNQNLFTDFEKTFYVRVVRKLNSEVAYWKDRGAR